MPIFVHLTPAKDLKRIVRAGIKHGGRGVFCMPMLPNYYISHQWIRELKRGGERAPLGGYFPFPHEGVGGGRGYFFAPTQVTPAPGGRVLPQPPRARGGAGEPP